MGDKKDDTPGKMVPFSPDGWKPPTAPVKPPAIFAPPAPHECCFHLFRGPLMMVVKDGHVVVKCCHCEHMKQVHRDHDLAKPSLRSF